MIGSRLKTLARQSLRPKSSRQKDQSTETAARIRETTSTKMTRFTLTTVNMLSTAQLPSHSTLNKTTAWFLIARSIRHCEAMLSAPCSHAWIAPFKYTQTQYKLSLAKSVEASTFWQCYFKMWCLSTSISGWSETVMILCSRDSTVFHSLCFKNALQYPPSC